jgi:hypothetical protein
LDLIGKWRSAVGPERRQKNPANFSGSARNLLRGQVFKRQRRAAVSRVLPRANLFDNWCRYQTTLVALNMSAGQIHKLFPACDLRRAIPKESQKHERFSDGGNEHGGEGLPSIHVALNMSARRFRKLFAACDLRQALRKQIQNMSAF